MSDAMSARELLSALESPEGIVEQRFAFGFVKIAEGGKELLFSPGRSCVVWVPLSPELIEKAYPQGKQACCDHEHEYVQLVFREANSLEDRALIDLLRAFEGLSEGLTTALTFGSSGSCKCCEPRKEFLVSGPCQNVCMQKYQQCVAVCQRISNPTLRQQCLYNCYVTYQRCLINCG